VTFHIAGRVSTRRELILHSALEIWMLHIVVIVAEASRCSSIWEAKFGEQRRKWISREACDRGASIIVPAFDFLK
jgi:hypothetical protein